MSELQNDEFDPVSLDPEEIERHYRKVHFLEAQKDLEYFRSPRVAILSEILERIQKHAREGKFTFEELGTSEEELWNLARSDYSRNAKYWLDALREVDPGRFCTPEDFLERLWEWMKKGRLSLEDIGTSEDELSQLVRKNHEALANVYLIDLWTDPKENLTLHLRKFRESVAKAGVTLEHLGTSEEELEKLRAT